MLFQSNFSIDSGPKSLVPCAFKSCRCRAFTFIPSRPEDVGEFWLQRRPGFNPSTWSAKCRYVLVHIHSDIHIGTPLQVQLFWFGFLCDLHQWVYACNITVHNLNEFARAAGGKGYEHYRTTCGNRTVYFWSLPFFSALRSLRLASLP